MTKPKAKTAKKAASAMSGEQLISVASEISDFRLGVPQHRIEGLQKDFGLKLINKPDKKGFLTAKMGGVTGRSRLSVQAALQNWANAARRKAGAAAGLA